MLSSISIRRGLFPKPSSIDWFVEVILKISDKYIMQSKLINLFILTLLTVSSSFSQQPDKAHVNYSLSGMVYTVDISESNPDLIYAGIYNDGIYKSEDCGSSWAKVLHLPNICSLTIDDNSQNTVYAIEGG